MVQTKFIEAKLEEMINLDKQWDQRIALQLVRGEISKALDINDEKAGGEQAYVVRADFTNWKFKVEAVKDIDEANKLQKHFLEDLGELKYGTVSYIVGKWSFMEFVYSL